MPNNCDMEKVLSAFPELFKQPFLSQLDQLIHYSPTIGLMGKSGVGKSSLINALFQAPLSAVNNVEGCTRTAQYFTMKMDKHTITFVDLPGVGENIQHDHEYRGLYRDMLPKLDLILWVLKADDRAWSVDQQCYHFLTQQCGYTADRFLFVINQADKIEPCHEWSIIDHQPSAQQAIHLQQKRLLVYRHFKPVHPVAVVSSKQHYQLAELAEQLVMALPAQASSGTAKQFKQQYRSERVNNTAKNRFGQCVSDLIDKLINQLPVPYMVKDTLHHLKQSLISTINSLWNAVFS